LSEGNLGRLDLQAPNCGQQRVSVDLSHSEAPGNPNRCADDILAQSHRLENVAWGVASRCTRGDHADEDGQITKALLQNVTVFSGLTETERSTISNRSIKLFTLSGIYHATQILLTGRDEEPFESRV